ncbi:mitochondrial substrate carrier family protein C [Senna tora]|uniref:Mitochondrial substrate carrier family protein C n=1 Tax=Senna tora TaxID=362788 RepID=A0A834TE57_9FABA|nr:mitochondrial substrate carrier family protein C [Senna tora]
MHPVDSIKTRVQASTLSFPEIISKLPQIGVRGLYRGSIPAILGQFSSHGLRTGIFEASKLVLINVAPTLPDLQVQSISSFCSTFLGTAVRIPCEVLKQRLQAGLFDNVGEAIVGTWHQDGLRGFFRGTGATLCREVPFYVAGMALYAESKKVVQKVLQRELEPWETIAVGALSGGLAAVVTTPFDVMKTRMMTAQGRSVSMTLVAFSILRHEGPLGLFKGAVPRFFWIAPLGAMNFAGYELARKAMNKNEELAGDVLSQKKVDSSD